MEENSINQNQIYISGSKNQMLIVALVAKSLGKLRDIFWLWRWSKSTYFKIIY